MMSDTETKYKNTSIGMIPMEWEIKKLGDLGQVLSGLTYSPNDVDTEGVLVLRSSNIQDDQLVFEDNVFVKNNHLNYNKVKENDILICVRNGSKSLIGKNAIITKKHEGIAFGAFMTVYRSSINSYLYHCFKSAIYKNYIKQNLGATINSINGTDLKGFKFPIPPFYEQQKIAQILSTWDKAIQETNNIIKALEKRNKVLAFLLLTGKKRLNGYNDNWEKLKFADITRRISRRNKNLIDAEVYSVTNSKGFVLQSEHFEGKIAGEDLANYKIIKKGEFAYNPARINVGSLAYFDCPVGIISSLYVCFEATKKVLDLFLLAYLKTDYVNSRINSLGEGGVRIYLWYELFSKIKINLPPIEEQNGIIKVLNTANEELQQYKQKLENLKQQKKGLMQQLLTGKIRVKN